MIPICGSLACLGRGRTSREDLLLPLPVARGRQPPATTAVLRKKVVLGSRCSVAVAPWACDEPREQYLGYLLLLTVPRLCSHRVGLPSHFLSGPSSSLFCGFLLLLVCPAAAAAASLQSCPTLCDPTVGSPPGSPVPGILQAGTLEWVATAFSACMSSDALKLYPKAGCNCSLVGGSHRTPNQPHYKKLESGFTFPEHLTVCQPLSTSHGSSHSGLTATLQDGYSCRPCFMGEDMGHRKVKLPARFPSIWQVIEQEFQARCLAVGAMPSPTVTHNWGILCVSGCETMCVSQLQHACTCPGGRFCSCGDECHLCDCLQVLTDITFSQWPSLITPFKIIHPSYLFFLSTTNKSLPSCFSCVQLFAVLWATAHQAPLSMGFSRQRYWSPPPGDLSDPGIKPAFLSSALAGGFFTINATWEAQ